MLSDVGLPFEGLVVVVLELVLEVTHDPVLDPEPVDHVHKEGTRLLLPDRLVLLAGLGLGQDRVIVLDVVGMEVLALVDGLAGLLFGFLTRVYFFAMLVDEDRVVDHGVLEGRQAQSLRLAPHLVEGVHEAG